MVASMTIFLNSEAEDFYQWPATFRTPFSKLLVSLFCLLFVFVFKVHIISKCIPESFFSSSQIPSRTFLIKETWILTIPSHAPLNIWTNTSNISLQPPLFPFYGDDVGVREAARRRQWGRMILQGDELQPRSALPLPSKGTRFIQRLQHLCTKSHIPFPSLRTLP